MTSHPTVSLIIVSRKRPAELRRVLASVRFLHYPKFEVVVVSDANPVTLFPEIPGMHDIKFVPFDEANISVARNLGLRFSAGDIVAFCDDDAVPEPTWLAALIAPFENPEVGAAGGYVRGRNGISFQWKGSTVDRYGNKTPLDLLSGEAVVLTGDRITAIKTEGTNMAFRSSVLRDLGGFDENYRYYLDETDVNYRLGLTGWKTAIVPGAQVHHGFAANGVRTHRRCPTDLRQIGASKAYFCKRHGEAAKIENELLGFRRAQRTRLIAAMVNGGIEPFMVADLMVTLESGIADGLSRRKTSANVAANATRSKFKPFMPTQKCEECIALSSRVLGTMRAIARARDLSRDGICVTLFRFSITARFHKMRYETDGFWIQTGGIFGKSDRFQSVFQLGTLKTRVKREINRLKDVRPMTQATKQ